MKFPFIPPVKCIKCGKELKSLDGEDYEEVDGGVVERLHAPYGSMYDGGVYQIGICDACIRATPEVVQIGDYMDGVDAVGLEKRYKEAEERLEAFRPTFEELKQAWWNESRYCAVCPSNPLTPSGEKLVALGINTVLPFIMEEMLKEPLEICCWFVILDELFKRKGMKLPEIPNESLGKMQEINDIYLEWLEEMGFLDIKEWRSFNLRRKNA
jgi:hypothetical protein